MAVMSAQLLAIDSASALDAEPLGACRHGQLTLIGVARRLSRDEQVFAEGDRADFVYKVISGAVRAIRLLADGRRQITNFYLPGDVFGIELGAERHTAAEAVCDATITSARRSSLTEGHDQPSRLWWHALRELQRSQDHVLALGRRTAIERVAIFLTDLADRMEAPDKVALPMSRQDIADYLGLTIETVSRTLTQMQAKGLLCVESSRKVRLLRRASLTKLCE
jgi:CRP/FNR family transcriptional regulator, nitrogen fixation regulation protein